MQPSGRIILDLTGKKSFFLWNGTESYYKKLRKAYTDIVNGQNSEYLYFGFCTLCASTLEYSLNYILVDYCVDKFGPENYKKYCEEYIGIQFRKKLIMIPHIVSEGKFMLNEANKSFQYLGELITLRNKILHNKDFLKEYNIPLTKDNQDSISSFMQEESELKLELDLQALSNYIDTITKDNCINFGNAIGDFKKLIMLPALNNDLKENAMINKITW